MDVAAAALFSFGTLRGRAARDEVELLFFGAGSFRIKGLLPAIPLRLEGRFSMKKRLGGGRDAGIDKKRGILQAARSFHSPDVRLGGFVGGRRAATAPYRDPNCGRCSIKTAGPGRSGLTHRLPKRHSFVLSGPGVVD